MSCITTFTHRRFDPLHPDPALICPEDIAHALSLMCRAGGHFPEFYSVAQHSICCAREAAARGCSIRVQLAALLHDAGEAYMADVTRPVKQEIPRYKELETALLDSIYACFLASPLTDEERIQVQQLDDSCLNHEFLTMMGRELCPDAEPLLTAPAIRFRPFREVEQEFLSLFHMLYSEQ